MPDHIGFSGQRLNQFPKEVLRFIGVMNKHGVRSYLEIGCRWGDTLYAVGMGLPEGSRIVGVDLPGIKTGGIAYEVQGTEPFLDRAIDSLCLAGRDARLIIGNSREREIIDQAKALGPFDAVLIDGDHTPEGVRRDWDNYGPMGRMVAFHDIMNRQKSWGVGDLFRELAEARRSKTIAVSDHRRGIGIIWN